MVCIYCGHSTRVINSRLQKRRNSTWRRRACVHCKAVFTSIETLDLATSLLVKDTPKHSEPFSRDKLLLSIYDSLKHRKTALSDAGELTDTVITRVLTQSREPIIPNSMLSETATSVLQRFDSIAATHYQAFYPRR